MNFDHQGWARLFPVYRNSAQLTVYLTRKVFVHILLVSLRFYSLSLRQHQRVRERRFECHNPGLLDNVILVAEVSLGCEAPSVIM
jgi:hypothetical protein